MRAEFDYIVVGAGSSGAVIAARLSEDPSVSVLLLEAGSRWRHPLQRMPLAFARVAWGRIGAVQYLSEPEPGLGGRQLLMPRGRTLGGTSAVNAMIAIRGNRRDYDDWSALGLPGWSYDSVLPYFRKLEASWRGAGRYHGADGPIAISRMEGRDLLWEPLQAAAEAAGLAYCDDANAAEQDGISPMESTVRRGRRVSTADAYLVPARTRSNLMIVTGAPVRQIVLERSRATGVEFERNGRPRVVRAMREVIVCAGAYNSPQLLLLSGIGPADELRAAGVPVRHDLPGVGRNLAEHPNVINEYVLHEDQGLTRHLRSDRAALAAVQWFANASGPFAQTGTMANVFARSAMASDRPDLQLMCMPLSGDAQVWFPGPQRRPPARLSVRGGYLHPKSRGWVRLRSADPRDPPRICMNVLTEPEDVEGMVNAVELSRSIYAQSPLREMIAREAHPGRDAGDLRDYIRRNATHRAHPVGTCRMGTGDDAVVDAELRVRGIQGLRVADASIMPTLPGGNTNLPCVMIGEKAADMISGRDGQAAHR